MKEKVAEVGPEPSYYDPILGRITPPREYLAFAEQAYLPKMHALNRQERLKTLAALKRAINPLFTTYLDPAKDKSILEVGCGAGFLKEMLVPDWLKEKLISFDINKPSLDIAAKIPPENHIFLGNIYQLPLADNTLDAVIGLSSFDSFLFLPEALVETYRCLKPGGKLILVQDLVPELYKFHAYLFTTSKKFPTSEEAVSRYHHRLIVNIKRIGGFKIIAGQEGALEATAIEPIKELSERVDIFGGIEGVPENTRPLLLASNLGIGFVIIRPEIANFFRWRERALLSQFHKKSKTQEDLSKIPYGPDDVIEWVRIYYLVAQKTEN